ncbi:DNase I-like protein [Rhizophagus irregularis]|uniref:DNase I-like protein n=1 Tax=Rhizophagus irregularis TaxID=588596 RepID=A0A2I1HAI7_9GLOM|nr:DNase I-like protein [Rhizophagus irregularis]
MANEIIIDHIIEEEINTTKIEEEKGVTETTHGDLKKDRDKDSTTTVTNFNNNNNNDKDFWDTDMMELTTMVDKINIKEEVIIQDRGTTNTTTVTDTDNIEETITQVSTITKDQTKEDIDMTEVTISNEETTDTCELETTIQKEIINTEEKDSTTVSTELDNMMMETDIIDKQIPITINEEEATSIMDVDIESTSTPTMEEEESSVNEKGSLREYIETNNINKNIKKNKNKTKINNIIKIGCVNIRGLNDDKGRSNKKQKLKEFIEKENWDIVGINETKIKKSKGKFLYKEWDKMKIRNNSAEEEKCKGSQLIIQKYWTELRTINYQELEGYAQSLDIVLKGNKKSIRIINIYMIGNNKERKNEITVLVDKWIENAKVNNLDIIVMGDFNERRQNAGKKDRNKFLDMLDSNNLVDVHLYFNNNEPIDTWSNGHISTRIDYIFVNS